MGILNIFIDTSSRVNDSNGDFLDLKSTQSRTKRIRVMPIGHLCRVFLIKTLVKKTDVPRAEFQALSKGANVRCLDCGWKYNFQSTTHCPVCTSDRTYLLSNGTFLASALTISLVVALSCGILMLAYRAITN